MDSLNFNSVESIPGIEARAAFTVNSSAVFKEDVDIIPTMLSDKLSYIPWGGNNQMPYNMIKCTSSKTSSLMYRLPVRG